jgi:ribosome biogenesis GTPase
MDLTTYGYTNQIQLEFEKSAVPHHRPARIISVERNSFRIIGEHDEMFADISGKLRFETESSSDFLTVGDWVCVEYQDNNTYAIIHKLLTRYSLLKRKVPGNKSEYQVLSANIDIAFIIQSLDIDFNLRRLERYLMIVNESNIKPVLLLSKTDLVSAEELQEKIDQVKTLNSNHQIIPFSNITGIGLEIIESLLEQGKTYCFIGSSGVGKTTLLNMLLEENRFITGEISKKDGKGQHITTRRQLTLLSKGGMIIDTPGMRELGIIEADIGMEDTFPEIHSLCDKCRFNNCGHTNEPGCAILAAIEKGEIQPDRLKSYNKLKKEAEFNRLSYAEKRLKDKKFGKYIKKVLEHHKKYQ